MTKRTGGERPLVGRPSLVARRSSGSVPQPGLLAIDCIEIEASLRAAGRRLIAGVDEVGRGCWAGPVYAAAVVLPPDCYEDRALLAEVTDSKLLSAAKRERLAEQIGCLAVGAAIGWAEAPVIDQLGIVAATRLAMRAALAGLIHAADLPGSAGPAPSIVGRVPEDGWGGRRVAGERVEPDYLLIDALPLPQVPLAQQAIVKGDRSCLCVAAASIIAKVNRDAEMRRRAAHYPPYALDDNKGYGTRRHATALHAAGITPLHRRSFAPMKYLLGIRDHVAGALPKPDSRACPLSASVEPSASIAQS
ncbi:MAG: ribonuclease HII [Chloroflexi bacterium]|nr:ribonuclease HII [Chloroflexota bacterium]